MVRRPLSILLAISLPALMLLSSTNGDIAQPHWTPEGPVTGEETTIFVTVETDPEMAIEAARINVSGNSFDLRLMDDDGNGSRLYSVSIIFSEHGQNTVHVETMVNGKWREEGYFTVNIEESGNGDGGGKRTILGLPSWYCSVSVIILTVIVIFLTWAYFRGRSMMKAKQALREDESIICSECAKPVGADQPYCPWCGTELEDEEYVCGKCGSSLKADDLECGQCGTRLKGPGKVPSRKRDLPTLEEKMKKNDSGKRECGNCGAVLMADEKICPVCGK